METKIYIVLGIGFLIALAAVIYQLNKAGSGVVGIAKTVKDWFVGPDVVVPPDLQHFIDESVNKPGGYTPWVPTQEPDEAYPPSWLTKGGK